MPKEGNKCDFDVARGRTAGMDEGEMKGKLRFVTFYLDDEETGRR